MVGTMVGTESQPTNRREFTLTSPADRNLLFGILALQMDFISRDALISAMHAWVLRKESFLGDLLQEQQALSPERCQLLKALVEEHVRQHGHNPRQSLESLSSASDIREELKEISDPDLRHSLQVVGAAKPAKSADPLMTRPLGEGTSAGTRFRILRPHAEGGLGKVSVARDEARLRELLGGLVPAQELEESVLLQGCAPVVGPLPSRVAASSCFWCSLSWQ